MQAKELKKINQNIEKVEEALMESLELLRGSTLRDRQTQQTAVTTVESFLRDVDNFKNIIMDEQKGIRKDGTTSDVIDPDDPSDPYETAAKI
jgi:hypothetical protein